MTSIDNYKLQNLIGKGSYGYVYEVKDDYTNKSYALKIDKSGKKSLFTEINILFKLRSIKNISRIIKYGLYNDSYYFVMERLSVTLENFYMESLKQPIFIKFIIQTMVAIKNIQQQGIIHRDIKPDNIMLNMDYTQVCIIDFGISKKYLDKNKQHKRKKINNKIQGTIRYASVFNHEGIELSRRDDIISFLYSIIYILNRGLPWQNMNDNARYLKILNKKKNISNEELCKSLHNNFTEILNYCYLLKYDEEPDYDYIILTLSNINKIFI